MNISKLITYVLFVAVATQLSAMEQEQFSSHKRKAEDESVEQTNAKKARPKTIKLVACDGSGSVTIDTPAALLSPRIKTAVEQNPTTDSYQMNDIALQELQTIKTVLETMYAQSGAQDSTTMQQIIENPSDADIKHWATSILSHIYPYNESLKQKDNRIKARYEAAKFFGLTLIKKMLQKESLLRIQGKSYCSTSPVSWTDTLPNEIWKTHITPFITPSYHATKEIKTDTTGFLKLSIHNNRWVIAKLQESTLLFDLKKPTKSPVNFGKIHPIAVHGDCFIYSNGSCVCSYLCSNDIPTAAIFYYPNIFKGAISSDGKYLVLFDNHKIYVHDIILNKALELVLDCKLGEEALLFFSPDDSLFCVAYCDVVTVIKTDSWQKQYSHRIPKKSDEIRLKAGYFNRHNDLFIVAQHFQKIANQINYMGNSEATMHLISAQGEQEISNKDFIVESLSSHMNFALVRKNSNQDDQYRKTAYNQLITQSHSINPIVNRLKDLYMDDLKKDRANKGLWLMKINGGNNNLLATFKYFDHFAAFSRDEKYLVVTDSDSIKLFDIDYLIINTKYENPQNPFTFEEVLFLKEVQEALLNSQTINLTDAQNRLKASIIRKDPELEAIIQRVIA